MYDNIKSYAIIKSANNLRRCCDDKTYMYVHITENNKERNLAEFLKEPKSLKN